MSETTELIYEPDWKARAERRLLVKWRKPRNRALMRALGHGAQVLEDELIDLVASTGLDQAVGDALDQWGEIVGEQRLDLGDNDYRQFIKARMLVNRTISNVDEMLEILEIAAAPVSAVWHANNYPSGFYLVVERSSFMVDEQLRRVSRLLEDARPAGRQMIVIESLVGGFGFAGDLTAEGYDEGPFSRLVPPPEDI